MKRCDVFSFEDEGYRWIGVSTARVTSSNPCQTEDLSLCLYMCVCLIQVLQFPPKVQKKVCLGLLETINGP